MTEDLPLAGLHIVVTRPREQATALASGIENLGGCCTLFPLLEILPLADDQPLRDLIARLHEFQLAIFISPNAVHYGMQAIRQAGGLPASVQIATVGLSSAKALKAYGADKVISPQLRFDSEALLELPEMQQVKDKRIAIFRGDSGRELLGDTLKLRGASIEYVTCYRRRKPQHDIATLLAAKPDALSVSSSEALQNLWEMSAAPDRETLTSVPLFVSHERIATAAHKLGWQQIICAAGGDDGLLTGLTSWAKLRKSQSANCLHN